ncbi:MAG: hypothetical protein IT285_08090 [Bdellovibrionales bacterium]|nr:hypothetical protein [Bdellovibrionales bacterium]
MALDLYDAESLARLAERQREGHWDLDRDIPWERSVDLSRGLVPLDDAALLFPGAERDQRRVISQFMGLVIAAAIYEMEEALLRLRKECWQDIRERHAVSPAFEDLGDLFFEEESKHSAAFRRFVQVFARAQGIDPEDLSSILPRVQGTVEERWLRANAKKGGRSFWWIVALVEQEFLLLYHAFKPFKDSLDPLYFTIHERHFEEEARHAPFPYLVLELLGDRERGLSRLLRGKIDLPAAQLVQAEWALRNLGKAKQVRRLASTHPFFEAIAACLPHLDQVPRHRQAWSLLTSVPYVSSFLNATAHRRVLREARDLGAWVLPFPGLRPSKLVGY